MQSAVVAFRVAVGLFALFLCVSQVEIMLSYDLDELKRPDGMHLPALSVAVLLMVYSWTSILDRALLQMSRLTFWAVLGFTATALGLTYLFLFGHMPSESRIHSNAPVNAFLACVFAFFCLLSVAGDKHVKILRRFKVGGGKAEEWPH